MKKQNTLFLLLMAAVFLLVVAVVSIGFWQHLKRQQSLELPVDNERNLSVHWTKPGKYWETSQYHTQNVRKGTNEVKAVILHHTADPSTAEVVAKEMCLPSCGVSCHVVIDTDGTRYVLAKPEEITFHAGYSKLGERLGANDFSIGIEFQGNTLERPLTDEQIESAVEYLRPIIKKYRIPAKNIVTHQMVRDAYMKAIPGNKNAFPKVDITPVEYERVLNALDTARLLK